MIAVGGIDHSGIINAPPDKKRWSNRFIVNRTYKTHEHVELKGFNGADNVDWYEET